MRLLNGCFAFLIILLLGLAWTSADAFVLIPWVFLSWYYFVYQATNSEDSTLRSVLVLVFMVPLAALCSLSLQQALKTHWLHYPTILIVGAYCVNAILNSLPKSMHARGLNGDDIKRIGCKIAEPIRLKLASRQKEMVVLTAVGDGDGAGTRE